MRSTNKTGAAMAEQVRSWEQSGLSKKEWCLRQGIAYATFQYWCQRLAETAAGKQPPPSFLSLQVQTTTGSATPFAELQLADGRRLSLYQPVSSDYLLQLLF